MSSIQPFIEGDNNCLGFFFEKNKGSMVLYVYSFVKDKEVAADIVLDVFHKLLSLQISERKERLSEDENHFKNIVFIILRNKALDHIKIEHNRKEIIEREFNCVNGMASNNAEELFIQDSFTNLLNELGSQQAKVVQMKMNGYSLDDISKELDISYNTARNTLSTARKKIKNIWKTFFE